MQILKFVKQCRATRHENRQRTTEMLSGYAKELFAAWSRNQDLPLVWEGQPVSKHLWDSAKENINAFLSKVHLPQRFMLNYPAYPVSKKLFMDDAQGVSSTATEFMRSVSAEQEKVCEALRKSKPFLVVVIFCVRMLLTYCIVNTLYVMMWNPKRCLSD